MSCFTEPSEPRGAGPKRRCGRVDGWRAGDFFVSAYRLPPSYGMGDHAHSLPGVALTLEGGLTVRCEGHTYEARPALSRSELNGPLPHRITPVLYALAGARYRDLAVVGRTL